MIRSISLLALAAGLSPCPRLIAQTAAPARRDAARPGATIMTTSRVVVTGVRRKTRGCARRRVGARAAPNWPARSARASATRSTKPPGVIGIELRPRPRRARSCAGSAATASASSPTASAASMCPRRAPTMPSAINPLTADRIEVLARPVGAAVRLVGDRRRGQRHRLAHPAPRSRAPRSCRRPARLRQRRQRTLGRAVAVGAGGRASRAPRRRAAGPRATICAPAATSCREPLRDEARASADPAIARARRPQGRAAQQRRASRPMSPARSAI